MQVTTVVFGKLLGQGGIGEFSLGKGNKIHLN